MNRVAGRQRIFGENFPKSDIVGHPPGGESTSVRSSRVTRHITPQTMQTYFAIEEQT